MNRRCALSVLSGCAASYLLEGCGAEGQSDTSESTERAVPLTAIPLGGSYASISLACGSATDGFIIGRDDRGVYAYSSACTHAGGLVPIPDNMGVSKCCLHGSQFDRNGDVIKGVVASQASLRHLKVRVTGSAAQATVYVDLAQEETNRQSRVSV